MQPNKQMRIPFDVTLHNKQPHIDEVLTGMEVDPKYSSDIFTFMLPHKHFDLSEGEVLWVDKRPVGYSVSVKQQDCLEVHALPCMWIHQEDWKPFGYTCKEFGLAGQPDVQPGDYNVGLRWLNFGGLETTDEAKRLQDITEAEGVQRKRVITTMMNWMQNHNFDCGHSIQVCAHTCRHTKK